MTIDANETKLVEDALSGVRDWESDMTEFFARWNTWSNAYNMINVTKEKRPDGISRNISGETTRAVNAIASTMTRMQTLQDPFFELRSDEGTEEDLFYYEKRYQRELLETQFKAKLFKGNRGLCLFGTQVWEEPMVYNPCLGRWVTDFIPLSLIQVAFRAGVYDMGLSDFIAPIHFFNGNYLRNMAQGDIWNQAAVEEGIKEKNAAGGTTSSEIEKRRAAAGYVSGSKIVNQELILYHGRVEDYENPLIAEMWQKYGRQDDPKNTDLTFGILNRKRLVRFHPTPYGTWKHLIKIGHYMEFELQTIANGVGSLGYELQKDLNRILRRVNDVALFSLYNMHFAGDGSGMDGKQLNVFPWSMIKVRDVNQIKSIVPQVEGIINGLKLKEMTTEDHRGVTQAATTLQAVLTGATATESSLAQDSAIRAIGLTAEIGADAYIRPHIDGMHKNNIDQNPYDAVYVRNVDFLAKTTTDKDYTPEHSKKLLELLTIVSSIRSQMPIDFNPLPIIKTLARSVGINPREFKEPRPQIDRMLDALRRLNPGGQPSNETAGEVASTQDPGGGVSEPQGPVPNAPMEVYG